MSVNGIQNYMTADDQEKHYERYLQAQYQQVVEFISSEQNYEVLRNKLNDLDRVLTNFLGELVISRPQHRRADSIQKLVAELKRDLTPDLVNIKI
jgi:hypothetical protein